jgi:hypothetical protein
MKHSLLSILLAVTLSSPALAGTFKSVTIDGSFEDWIGVPLAYEDPADTTTAADYRLIWIANDEDFIYLRFTLERPEDPFTANDNIFIDADDDPTTGFGIIVGSELLIQGGAGYQEKNGGFNEGAIDGLQWLAAPSGTGTQFEARFSRRATFASDGTEVFFGPFFSLILEAEDANFARQETAPDDLGLFYEVAEPPPAFMGSTQLIALNSSWRHNSTGADLGTEWAQPDYDDTQSGWSEGTALLGYSPNAAVYPAPIVTALPAEPTTHYLRTTFSWQHSSSGVLLVATNYLSDGARFFLNGAEVNRIRLEPGPVTSQTPATGGPAVAGQGEIFALPTGPLVQGDNVLGVEVHQATASPEDLVFGLSLLASDQFPIVFTDPAAPADRAVVGGEPTVFEAAVIGSPPLEYQWLKDGAPIEGGTNATLELETVLPDDAGTYSLRVSNPVTPGGVISREAVLTVLGVPVSITRHPQPLTVIEGLPATFTVEVTGSAPITYQWLKDGTPIEGATNASYAISEVSPVDAGLYSVRVSNPVPDAALESQQALLTVSPDTAGPVILELTGSPNQVVLAFSEPVDPASAQDLSNYSLSGGLTATGAALDPADPSVVLLATAPQTLGTRYEVTVESVEDRFGNATAPFTRAFISAIRIDGAFDDWQGVEQVVDDPADAENATDYAAAWIASDGDFIYLRVRLHQPSELGIFYNNLFIDTDNDSATGFSFQTIGSELLMQGGGGYQQKNGAFNEGAIEDLDWAMQPEGTASEFELRFSRRSRYSTDGQPVFAGESIALFLESENTSFQTIDVAPDLDPILHVLSTAPPSGLGRLTLTRSAEAIQITWSGPGRLESTGNLTSPDWQPVANATSPYSITPTDPARFYRLTLE